MQRHRAAQRADPPAAPRDKLERTLVGIQRKLARSERETQFLEAARDDLTHKLWTEERRPVAEIAALLDQADRDAGGAGVTYAAVQKRLHRRRT